MIPAKSEGAPGVVLTSIHCYSLEPETTREKRPWPIDRHPRVISPGLWVLMERREEWTVGPKAAPQTALGPMASSPWQPPCVHIDIDKLQSDFSESSARLDPNLSLSLSFSKNPAQWVPPGFFHLP